jgi:hypothetical protein
VQMATGRTKQIPLHFRAAVLAVSVAATFFAFVTYVPQSGYQTYPRPNILANTWYGPALVMSVSIALGWLSFGLRRRWLRVVALGLSILLLLGGLYWIYVVRAMSGTLPDLLSRPNVW